MMDRYYEFLNSQKKVIDTLSTQERRYKNRPKTLMPYYKGELPISLKVSSKQKIADSLIRFLLYVPELLEGTRLDYNSLAENLNYSFNYSANIATVNNKINYLVKIGFLGYHKHGGKTLIKANGPLKLFIEKHVSSKF